MSILPKYSKIMSAFCLLFFSINGAQASFTKNNHKPIESSWQLVSTAQEKWLWIDVYQAELYIAENAQKTTIKRVLDDGYPLKLKLCYQRDITAETFVQAANKGLPPNLRPDIMKAVEKLHKRYRSVSPGDCYSLNHYVTAETELILNDEVLFKTSVPDFKSVYYGLWLGENPLSEKTKQVLLKKYY